MLTVMCPNCRHRFPAPGCCSQAGERSAAGQEADREAPRPQHRVTISTQCGIQSGGCLIQSSNAELLVEGGAGPPRLELRSAMSGGGCLVQKRPEPDHQEPAQAREQCRPLLISEEQLRTSFEQAAEFHRSHSTTARLEAPPSGCQELPGTRREKLGPRGSAECRCCCYCRCCYTYCRRSSKSCCTEEGCRRGSLCQVASNCASRPKECEAEDTALRNDLDASAYSGDVRIQVNATVHLPCASSASVGSCTLSITASTSTSSTSTCGSGASVAGGGAARLRNNFNGGGIVTLEEAPTSGREETPGTPVSWLTPCPWSFDGGYLPEKDVARLAEVRRLLQTCGWYHEGLSWQQSENLLKDAPVGRWLMRDSSDIRYTFAISVQTARGPTSVRVFYFMGKFRLDAEPRLALAMPLFDCPIKMLEYYCEYSKRMDEHRQEVWVDYSGQVYSQIYLSEPLVKEVRSLSHLARIAVNRGGSASLEKERKNLPPLIRNYLNEYPYTL